jgi:hypothetical protein
MFNKKNAFVTLTAMTEKQGSECIKGALVRNDTNKAKLTAAIALAGIIVISGLLLSGLTLISSYQQPVIAQQQSITGDDGVSEGGATIAGNTTSTIGSAAQGGNATTTAGEAGGNQSEVRLHLEEARAALQNGNTEAALLHLDLALNALGGAGGIQGNTTTTGTTIAGTDATNTSNEDASPTNGGTSAADEDSECGGVTVGGTSAADDYGCPPDPDG